MATVYNSTHTGQQIDNILDMIYPVGSIYLSVNNVDPSTLFGGTWERIEGKFLLASSSTHAIGTIGGEESHSHSTGNHTLTVNEIPIHAHTVYLFNANNTNFDAKYYNSDGSMQIGNMGGRLESLPWQSSAFKTAGGDGIGDPAGNAGPSGGGAAHNHGDTNSVSNMPPYLTVNMWKRIS